MKITLNNREEVFASETITIAEIMALKKYTYQKIIVKLNDAFIEKEDYDKTYVNEADNLVILHLLAGG